MSHREEDEEEYKKLEIKIRGLTSDLGLETVRPHKSGTYDYRMLFEKLKDELAKFGLTANQTKVFLFLEKLKNIIIK